MNLGILRRRIACAVLLFVSATVPSPADFSINIANMGVLVTNCTGNGCYAVAPSCPSYGRGVNNLGYVAGTSMADGGAQVYHGFLWTGAITELLPPDSDMNSGAAAVNYYSQVVGNATFRFQIPCETMQCGMLWVEDTPYILTTGIHEELNDINDYGQAVGAEFPECDSHMRAILWQPDTVRETTGAVYNLEGSWTSGAESKAYGLSPNGKVVGYFVSNGKKKPFLWIPSGNNGTLGTFTYLSLPSSASEGIAYGVNDYGRAVGMTDGKMTVWTTSSGNILYRDADACAETVGYAINAQHHVVGVGSNRATLWLPDSELYVQYDLYNLLPANSGWANLVEARDLSSEANGSLYITGTGCYNAAGNPRAYRITLGLTPPVCPPGDTNGDCCVDDADLSAIILDYGGPPSGENGQTDVDFNGVVDDADLTIATCNYGVGC